MWKTKVVIGLLSCCLISSSMSLFSIDHSVSAATATTTTDTPAASSDMALEADGYRYYRIGTKGKDAKLISQKIGSSKKTTLTTKDIEEFYVNGSYVYYVVKNTKTSKHSIYRVRRDGKKSKCIVTAFQLRMIGIQGNCIYYDYYKKYNNVIVARIKVNGDTASQKILSTTSTNYSSFNPVLTNNHIYYTNNKKSIIYSLTLGGKNTAKLVSGTSVRDMMAGDDGLYYLCDTNEGTIKSCVTQVMKVDFKGTLTVIDTFDQDRVIDCLNEAGVTSGNEYTSFLVYLEDITDDAVYYSLTDTNQLCYLYQGAKDGSGSTLFLKEADVMGASVTPNLFDFEKGKEDTVIAYGGEENPVYYYYLDAVGVHQVQDTVSKLTVVGNQAYYMKINQKKRVYGSCKLTKLLTAE